jgi:hypothetical protein
MRLWFNKVVYYLKLTMSVILIILLVDFFVCMIVLLRVKRHFLGTS